MKERIVITGLGVVSSIGVGKDEFWKNLLQGKSGISKVESFDTTDQFTHYGGEIKNFDPAKGLDRRYARLVGRASLLGMAASKLAVKDSARDFSEIKNKNVAVCIGTTGGEGREIEKIDSIWLKNGKDNINNQSIIKYPVSNMPSNIASALKIKGLTRIFTTACASGNYGIGYAYDLLQLRKADVVLAGGSDAFSYLAFTGFNQVGAVAPEMCQPFDKNRKGIIPAEGAGILILERLDDALKRDAPIYAEILGYGLSCDAFHITQPDAEGVSACMRNALAQAGISENEVDYICAHGTGTPHNDKTETKAIYNVFKDRAPKIPVSSIKSMLGHAMGAASAIEAISCALTVSTNMIPPTINYQMPDPECDIDCVPNMARKQEVDVALNNAFAFGGNNSCVVIKKYKRS